MTTQVQELRVFPGPDGAGGNPLGVIVDGPAVPVADRQAVAAALGYSETVFVDDPESGAIRIFTPAAELGFAGHPTVGTAWLLGREGFSTSVLRPPAGELPITRDGDLTWIRARPEWATPMTVRRFGSAADIDALPGHGEDGVDFLYAWAWIDEAAGIVRSRSYPTALGITEDEATGAAAVYLTGELGRELEIRQGVGSVLHARPGPDGTVDLGGRVTATASRVVPAVAR